MKSKLLIALLMIVGFWGLASLHTESLSNCVNVYVDFGSLDNNKKVIGCINIDHKTNAAAVIEYAGFKLEGTKRYGMQVVCRVDSLPKLSEESCESMPPENAYWAVITKQEGPVSVAKKWGWAQSGISDVYLNPGDSIGLVFVKDGKMKWPD